MEESEREARRVKTLSKDLKEALGFFKNSHLVKKTIGDHLFAKIIQNKEIEWRRYQEAIGVGFDKKVSPYEIKEYLPVL